MSHTSRRSVHINAIAAAALIGAAMSCICTTVAHAEPTVEELENRADEAARDFEVIVEDYNAANSDLESMRARHHNSDLAHQDARAQVAAADAALGDVAETLYRGGEAGLVTPFLEGSVGEIADRMTALESLGLARDSLMEHHDQARAALDAETTRLDGLRTEVKTLRDEKDQARDRVESAEDELRTERAGTTEVGFAGSGDEPPEIPGGIDEAAATAVQFAYDQIGKPYKWGEAGPDGFDCSGLTSAAWSEAGVDLPHNAAAQSKAVAKVSRDELQPGDLVFYYEDVHHVALFAGEGKVVHAPTPGENVKIAGIDDMPVQGYGRPG